MFNRKISLHWLHELSRLIFHVMCPFIFEIQTRPASLNLLFMSYRVKTCHLLVTFCNDVSKPTNNSCLFFNVSWMSFLKLSFQFYWMLSSVHLLGTLCLSIDVGKPKFCYFRLNFPDNGPRLAYVLFIKL